MFTIFPYNFMSQCSILTPLFLPRGAGGTWSPLAWWPPHPLPSTRAAWWAWSASAPPSSPTLSSGPAFGCRGGGSATPYPTSGCPFSSVQVSVYIPPRLLCPLARSRAGAGAVQPRPAQPLASPPLLHRSVGIRVGCFFLIPISYRCVRS